MTSKKPRLYFAAPLFTQAEWQWNLRLAEKLSQLNIEVVLPQKRAEPMLFGSEVFDSGTLFTDNVEEIEKADVVLAILDQADPDSGTCWECGYAYKSGRPIIGLRTDIRKSGDDPTSGVNLMLSMSCTKFLLVPWNERDDLTWVANQLAKLVNQVLSPHGMP